MENWAPASTVKGLFSAEAAPAGGGPPLAETLPSSQQADSSTGAYAQQFSAATQLAGAASRDAAGAFKNLLADPWGRVGAAYEQLGPPRALIVGAVFLGVFALCCILAAIIRKDLGIPGAFDFVSLDAASFFKSLFILIGYIGTLIGVVSLFRVLAQTGVAFAADLFVVGSSLLPLGVYSVLFSMLNLSSGVIRWMAAVLFIFAAITSVLMLFNGLNKAVRLSDRMAGLAVPTVLAAGMSVAALLRWLFF
jgi:hypothetical protein